MIPTDRLAAALLAFVFALPVAAAGAPVPVWSYRVVHAYPHDPGAFTEGLFWKDGYLYESTGLNGRSTVRQVRLETGEVVQRVALPDDVFGEGIVDWKDRLIGLTWQSQIGFVLDRKTFELKGKFGYPGEGWGLTHDDREIIMSDGTAELRFLDPDTLRETHRIKVVAGGEPVKQLNELEWVDGEVFANIWQTDRIARIDPKTGQVVGWIDLSGLLRTGSGGPRREDADPNVDVLNGIAWDAATHRLFVTGKFWPKLFEIKLVKRAGP